MTASSDPNPGVDYLDKILSNVYYNLESPACYSGINAVYLEARKRNKAITRDRVVNFLQKQKTYTKHKPVQKRFKRNKIIPIGFDTDWQADLADMQKLKKFNQNFGYIMVVVDVLSRYVWTRPLKTKSPVNTAEAFKTILNTGRKCWRLCTDKGTEWYGKPFKDLLLKHDIKLFSTQNQEIKSALAERSIRTLKTRLWKFFTEQGTNEWLSVLPKLTAAINNSLNRTIGCTPSSVTRENATQLWLRLYGTKKQKPHFKFNIGDMVRIAESKNIFAKGYAVSFSEEIFTICKKLNRIPAVYRLKDHTGEILDGTFYEKELCKIVKTDDIYEIEKILRSRVRSGQKEVYIKWKGYPASSNSWEPISNIVSN